MKYLPIYSCPRRLMLHDMVPFTLIHLPTYSHICHHLSSPSSSISFILVQPGVTTGHLFFVFLQGVAAVISPGRADGKKIQGLEVYDALGYTRTRDWKIRPVLASPVGLYVVDGAEALSKDLESRFSCITILLLLLFVSQLLRLYPQRKGCTTRPSPLLSALDSSLLSNLTIDVQTKIHSFKKARPLFPWHLLSRLQTPNTKARHLLSCLER